MKVGDIVHCVDDSCRGWIPQCNLHITKILDDFLEVQDLAGKKYVERFSSFRRGKIKPNRKRTVSLPKKKQVLDFQYEESEIPITSSPSYKETYESFIRIFPELNVKYTSNPVSWKVDRYYFNSKFDGRQIYVKLSGLEEKYFFLLHEICHFLEAGIQPYLDKNGQMEADVFRQNWGLGLNSFDDHRETKVFSLEPQIRRAIENPRKMWRKMYQHNSYFNYASLGTLLLEKYKKFWPHLLDRSIFKMATEVSNTVNTAFLS
jgi:hypothetical protein